MTKRETLLAFIAAGDAPVDPVRIMKGMFLFAQESGEPEPLLYDFVPYSYGPCSFDIYRDLDQLVAEGLIEKHTTTKARWPLYSAQPEGRALSKTVFADDVALGAKLAGFRQDVDSRSFTELLKHVYGRYPDFAKNSLFRG